MSQANHRTTPLPKSPHFDDECNEQQLNNDEAENYRALIGDLRYLADSTRMDIAFATARLARHTAKPTTAHWKLTNHILRYLKHTRTHGILYTAQTQEPLKTYCDADFANAADRKSITGAIHTAFGSPVQWASKKQATVALSTCEAEYVAASQALQETLWLRRMIQQISAKNEIENTTLPPTTIATDSLPAIKVANHEGKTRRRKHIDVKHHHLAHHVDKRNIQLQHIQSDTNPADAMTKPLGPQAFSQHMTKMISPIPANTATPN